MNSTSINLQVSSISKPVTLSSFLYGDIATNEQSKRALGLWVGWGGGSEIGTGTISRPSGVGGSCDSAKGIGSCFTSTYF